MNPDPDLLAMLLFALAALIGFPIARAFAPRISAAKDVSPLASGPSDVTARLDRIEHMIESTQIEVERISEGQRFTTKLLAERATVEIEEHVR